MKYFIASKKGRRNKVESGGGTRQRKAPELFLCVVPLHFFGSICTTGRFGECFHDGQYSLASFLSAVFFLLTVPHVPSHL